MVGCASERILLRIRDRLVAALPLKNEAVPKSLQDWRLKTVLAGIDEFFRSKRKLLPAKLSEAFETNWPALTGQIRMLRNDAGHPTAIDAVSEEAVHASLLIFPEVAKLQKDLMDWIKANYS
jgi:hypothetical protein